MRGFIRLSGLLIGSFGCLFGTEYSPWFGPVLEIETRATAYVEYYPEVEGVDHHEAGIVPGSFHHRNLDKSATNFFLDLSGSIAPTEYLSVEIEGVLADTYHRSFGFDSLLLTGRYRFWNDIVGDPLSVSAGLQLIKVFEPAWHDASVFHHGGIGVEGHIAAGKEFSCMQFWVTRLWGVAAMGVGDVGSPWLKADIVWEHNWWDIHEVRLFAHTLWGLGGDRLNFAEPFKGYGPINHQSVDLGARYSYLFYCGLSVNVEYGFRVFARNCPEWASIASIGIHYDFGL